MSDDEPSGSASPRREWRTEQEWVRLRSRIESAETRSRTYEPLPEVTLDAQRRLRWRPILRHVGLAAGLMIAAVCLTVVGRSWVHRNATAQTRAIATKAGERLVVRLADSSVITLGPLSRLRYELTPERRSLFLSGLASFRVVHDAARPMIIQAGRARIEDLGTEFVVRAYESDSTVEVAVTSGVVSLSPAADRAATVKLVAGNVGRLSVTDALPTVQANADVAVFATWIEGGLAFDDTPLTDVARQLGRWYGVEVRVTDSSLARRRITAVYPDPTLPGVLDALATTLGARWERSTDGRSIMLRRGLR